MRKSLLMMTKKEFIYCLPYIEDLGIIKYFAQGKMPVDIQTKPMNSGWKKRIEKEWWSVSYDATLTDVQKEMILLRESLLAIGGEEVYLPIYEIHLDNIKSFGQLWGATDIAGDDIFTCLNHRDSCFSCAKSLWNSNRLNTLIAQGYALSEDSMWRRRSWLIYLNPIENLIVDTEKHIAYFGYAMTYKQCNEMFYGCL